MPKLKSKSGAKKRFRYTARGKVRMNVGYKSHNLRKRPKKMKRQARGTAIMADVDVPKVKQWLPYGQR